MPDEVSNTDHRPRHRAAEGEPEPTPEARRRFVTGFTSLRDLLAFVAGVAIIGHEVFFSKKVDVSVLTVGVTLCGLPVVFGADEKRKS